MQRDNPMPGDNTTDVARELGAHHAVQHELCDQLENVADTLPARAEIQTLLHLARVICPIVNRAHSFEETVLFPAVLKIEGRAHPLSGTLERLRFEHLEDESFAAELAEALLSFALDDRKISAETLAYMLRGFFEGVRRHIAFEKEHILPLVSHAAAAPARL